MIDDSFVGSSNFTIIPTVMYITAFVALVLHIEL